MARRTLLVAGAATASALVAGQLIALPASGGGAVARVEPTVASCRQSFDHLRRLGQYTAPRLLIPHLATHVRGLRRLASRARPAGRDAALVLAARFAEYAGWQAQESGDDGLAGRWTQRAVEFAAAGGDADMAGYALVRRGLIALYRHDAATTVDLARIAQSAIWTPRIRGLAAQREAQGHALAGDYGACMRALDRAATHLYAAAHLGIAAADREPALGTTHVADVVTMATGWCLVDVGRPRAAAEILDAEVERIPARALRARARYGARLALAYAASGEPEAACAAVAPILHMTARLESATIAAELTDLAGALYRWREHPAVRPTWLRLAAPVRHTGPVHQAGPVG